MVLNGLQRRFLPNKVLVVAGPDSTEEPQVAAELLRGKTIVADAPTLYVCEGFTCQAPAQGQKEIEHALDELMPVAE